MKKYINIKTQYGVETWDMVDSEEFESIKEYKVEIRNLINNYKLAGYNVYSSQRPSKN